MLIVHLRYKLYLIDEEVLFMRHCITLVNEKHIISIHHGKFSIVVLHANVTNRTDTTILYLLYGVAFLLGVDWLLTT